MKIGTNVPELVEVFKEIQKHPEHIFEMIRLDIGETVGEYLTVTMGAEPTRFHGREPYAHGKGNINLKFPRVSIRRPSG